MNYHFRIHNEGDGWWGECLELDGCKTQSGDGSREGLSVAMAEALDLYLDEPDHGEVFPLPDLRHKGKRQVVEVPVDPGIALALRLRQMRRELGISQQEAAKRAGMTNLYSWQRLEKGSTANPSLRTLARLKGSFRDLKLEELVP
jgi:DNA-binding XRE family transcriptional regulator